jgi:hypothetical protein
MKLNAIYLSQIKLFPSILKTLALQVYSSVVSSKNEHTSADASEVILSSFKNKYLRLTDGWDYFIFNTSLSAKNFMESVLVNAKSDLSSPLIVCVEKLNAEYKHESVMLCTIGIHEKNYYTTISSPEHTIMITKDIGRAIEKFLGEKESGGINLPKVGDSLDTGVQVGSKVTEPIFGYAIYTFPIDFQEEAKPLNSTTNEYKLALESKFDQDSKREPVKDVLEEIRESLGSFKNKVLSKHADDSYLFENGSISVPSKFEYDFKVRTVVKDGEPRNVFFRDFSNLRRFIYDATEGKVSLDE